MIGLPEAQGQACGKFLAIDAFRPGNAMILPVSFLLQ
ncbi:hypothetical protein GGR04_004363 [Aureimonas pseudogalii]|uniref:Uncharacterized protein n=1 Tax=Aureimonas pseudogalii TaxID=1744844 RepID=A0A7W6MM46_9HYPH|nr:hypothetical protein [Aureimonas pseudogalii]